MLNDGMPGGVAPLSEVSFFSQKCHLYDANKPGSPYCRGRLSTTGLLVLTIIDLLLFLLNLLLSFCTKQATFMWWSTVLSLPLQLVFPVACTIKIIRS
jgi:hypothetical protein